MKKLFLVSAILLSVFTNAQENSTDAPLLAFADSNDLISTKTVSAYTYIQLENIYFTPGQSDVKTLSTETLDNLIKLLYKYPSMEIELRAHTDTKGEAQYNLKLSQERAQSAYQYILNHGINPSRLSAKGYGESDPLVPCEEDCNKDQDEINRRCEIVIVR